MKNSIIVIFLYGCGIVLQGQSLVNLSINATREFDTTIVTTNENSILLTNNCQDAILLDTTLIDRDLDFRSFFIGDIFDHEILNDFVVLFPGENIRISVSFEKLKGRQLIISFSTLEKLLHYEFTQSILVKSGNIRTSNLFFTQTNVKYYILVK